MREVNSDESGERSIFEVYNREWNQSNWEKSEKRNIAFTEGTFEHSRLISPGFDSSIFFPCSSPSTCLTLHSVVESASEVSSLIGLMAKARFESCCHAIGDEAKSSKVKPGSVDIFHIGDKSDTEVIRRSEAGVPEL